MNQFTSKRKASLCLALLTSVFLTATAKVAPKAIESGKTPAVTIQPMVVTEKPAIDAKTLEVIQSEVYRQLERISMAFDTLGQHNATKKEKNKNLNVMLQALRNDVKQIQKYTANQNNSAQELYQIALLIQELISCLDKAVESKLAFIPEPNMEKLAKRSLAAKDITLDKINAVLKQNSNALIKLAKDAEQIGLTSFNKIYRNFRKLSKAYYIPQIAEHVAVYSAMVCWITYVTSKEKLPKFLLPLKEKMSSTPKTSTNQDESNTKLIEEIELTPEVIQLLKEKKDLILNEKTGQLENQDGVPVVDKDGKILFEETVVPFEGSFSKVIRDPLTRNVIGFKAADGDFEKGKTVLIGNANKAIGKKSYSTPSTSHDHSIINASLDTIKAFLNVNNASSIFEISTHLLFASYIKRDAEKLADFWDRKKHKLDDIFFGTARHNNYDDMSVRSERFKDIVGREEVKTEFARVIEYIVNPDAFDRAGIKVERGYLLAGTPQTGKTLMAKALAGEISAALERAGKKQKVRLFEISTENLAKKGIAYYMALAKTQAPCILFLDELDLLRLQRDGDTGRLSEFLTSMSGSLNSNEKDHVIILAATNKPENVDFALRQHGRFGKMFWFDHPTFKHRAEFFKKECEKRCMNISSFDFLELARQTEGCSFGTLDIVVKIALMRAKLEKVAVTQNHFERAIDSEVRKLIPHGYVVPADKELIVAVRQASKALTSLLLNPAKSLCSVTVLPITQELEEEHVTQQYNISGMKGKEQRAVCYGGIFAYHLYDALDIRTQAELVKQCKINLAGNVGQKAFGLASPAFDKTEKQEAFKFAKQIVLEGLDVKEMAKTVREEKLTEAYRLLDIYELEVEKLLIEHKEELGKIVAALQKRKTLSVGEIYELLEWSKDQIPTIAVA